ncbi:ly6/PLAUR domain-containing protein 3-like [Bombina bombina]|uniref:ly6/PLAUR domain-containing protein 3-like n=1 Tax=Bombina bombina TaxID=8345 RepID=UPI00235A51F7|nr:ly6/PLAUR domain-containing protein 3-like [Bombina bombina]
MNLQWVWKGKVPIITTICLMSTLIIQGVLSQPLECIHCIDRDDNGCSEGNATKIVCQENEPCIELVTSVETSHDQFTMLIKGCGKGGVGRLDKAINFHGITMFVQFHQCDSSLCNTNMELKNYQLLPPDTTNRQPNQVQCYSCVGKTEERCTTSNAPDKTCFNNFESCFDGKASITIGNETQVIPIKSCSTRNVCPRQLLTLGSATFGIQGACCRGNLCNQDLSNQTQYESGPPLLLLEDLIEKKTTTVNTTAWLTTEHQHNYSTAYPLELTTPHLYNHSMATKKTPIKIGRVADTNSTVVSVNHNDHSNTGPKIIINLCLFLLVQFLHLV